MAFFFIGCTSSSTKDLHQGTPERSISEKNNNYNSWKLDSKIINILAISLYWLKQEEERI
jgi:hypothetical protein